MPNHIKNRIELLGDSSQIKELMAKYSTHYETCPNTTYDGALIYKKIDEKYSYGWLDPKTGVFTRREQPDVNGVPDGYVQDMEPAWTRFPDFNKIVPMPAALEDYNPCHNITTAIEAKYNTRLSDSPLLAIMQQRSRQEIDFKFNEGQQAMFDRGCKNYEETGYIYWYDWACDNWGTKWNAYSCEQLEDNVFVFETAWAGVPALIAKMAKEFPSIKITYEYSDEDTGNNCGIYQFNGDSVIGGKLENESNAAYELAFKLRPDRRESYILTQNGYKYNEEADGCEGEV